MAHKLLLADDSITIQKVVSLTFAEEDFEVICVGNGEIAIEKIGEIRPDVILADIFMPRKTGYEVCEFVKQTPHLRHIPVILLVGTFEPFDKNEAARVGADAHVTKPFETTSLIRLVRQSVASAPKPAAAPPRPVAAPVLDADRTFQIQLSELDERLGRTQPPKPAALPEILDIPALKTRQPAPQDLERTLLSAPVQPAAGLGPDEVILEPEEELIAPPAAPGGTEEEELFIPAATPVPAAEPDLLAVPSLARRLHRPADEDILGIFELIGLDRLIARQQSLEDAVRREREAAAAPRVAAVAEPEPAAPSEDFMIDEAVATPAPVVSVPAAAPVMPAREPAEAPVPAAATELNEDLVTRIARMVIERLSEKAVREIAWEVVPDLSETIIRNELKRLKDEGKF